MKVIVIKVKPYIIKKINNITDFKIIQDELYEQGYYFLGDRLSEDFLLLFHQRFPFYISNLPFSGNNEKTQIKRRVNFGQMNNCVLWMADSENEFDLSKLRYEKLCTISEL
jgi:hypothetical protein